VGGGRGLEEFALPFGFVAPTQSYAMLAHRYMHEFGLTSEQLGWIAVVERKRANQNPNAAMYGKAMSIEDHQNSRLISSPLRLFDCCLETDNAAAAVITSAKRAASLDCKPVAILAATMGSSEHSHGPIFYSPMEAGLTSTAADAMAPRLYSQCGLTASDIDVAQIYDSFTIAVLAQLEAYGFCAKGEGGAFVQGGSNIDLDGEIPINTFGGQLSAGYVNGFSGIIEGARQLRGEANVQVEDATTCLVTGGMLTTTSALILGRP
jgi:acetyl-CoA acetyltransferase